MADVQYHGCVDPRGRICVFRDGKPLSPVRSQRAWNHSPEGFNWGYAGSGPAQLALALLLDVGLDTDLAIKLHQEFKRVYVSHWETGLPWTMTRSAILDWVLDAELAEDARRKTLRATPTPVPEKGGAS